MTVIVEVPGHGEVEFPDGMSDAEMEAAIRKNFMLPAKEKPKATFASGLAETGKAAAKGFQAGGPVGMAAGAMQEGLAQGEGMLNRLAYNLGGRVTDALAGKVSPEVAGGAGYLANVATQAAPTMLAGTVAKKAAPMFRAAGRSLMQSSLKPSKAQLASGKAKRAVQTMLDEGVNVSSGGVEKMQGTVDDINNQIRAAISGSPATVDKNAVASRLNDTVQKFQNQVNPGADLGAIDAAKAEFLAHPALQGRNDIPVQLAQDLKQGTYKVLKDKAFGEVKSASTEAQKALARGLKEEVGAAVPGVASMNARESDIINALKIAQNRVLMDANKNPLGLGALISQPWMLPVWMWDRSPLAKSLTARALYSGAEQIPATLARGGMAALMAPTGQPPEEKGILYR